MIQLLLDNPLLLLFTIVAIGYPLGQIKIGQSRLGVAAVLFVGIGIGSLHPDLKLPEVIYLFGLLIFIYTIGLSSGPGFFASFRRKGLRDNLFVVSMIVLAGGLTVGATAWLNLKPTMAVGMFAGSLTNTPALAAILEAMKGVAPAGFLDQWLAEPVVGYSISYPMGVVGMLLAISWWRRRWQIDYTVEAQNARELGGMGQQLINQTIRITRPEVTRQSVRELVESHRWNVVFGRVRHKGEIVLSGGEMRLAIGDLISVVGERDELAQVTAILGELTEEHLTLDRTEMDYRRMFVSNPKVAGHRLRDLNLPQQFGAFVTRLRRGDVEFLPHGDTLLEPGDRVRVVAKRERMKAIGDFFGDSYRMLSEIDILTFSLGLCLGLLLGLIPVPLPGGVTFKLGMAGGPLIVALILGTLGRSGPLVWSLPYSANLTLRQLGLILFLAGVGTRAGYLFVNTFVQGGGIVIFLAGTVITTLIALVTLWIGYRLLHIPFGVLIGMLAGLQTQPAVLGFALEQSGNELPNVGYATVFPFATITKILLAQLLLSILLGM